MSGRFIKLSLIAVAPLFLTGCLEDTMLETSKEQEKPRVEQGNAWEDISTEINEDSMKLVDHMYQITFLGEQQETLILGTQNGVWRIDLSDVSLNEKVLGEEVLVEGEKIEAKPQEKITKTSGADWAIHALSGFDNPYGVGSFLFASGKSSEEEGKGESPYPLGLLLSQDEGETWDEVGGVYGETDFNLLAAGAVEKTRNGEFASNTQWGVVGVDSASGALLTNVVDVEKKQVLGNWSEGPKGNYSSVTVVDGFILALDADKGVIHFSEDSGGTWKELRAPGCAYLFTIWQIPGVRGELFMVLKNGDLMYLPKTTEDAPAEELIDRLAPVGKFPTMITEGAAVGVSGAKSRVAISSDDRLYLSGDWGSNFNPLVFSLQESSSGTS